MKWVYLIAVLLATIIAFAVIPNHDHALVYIGSGYLILSYVLIPRKPQLGWNANFTGNLLYLTPVAHLHRIDLMVVPVVFTALSLYNLWQSLTKPLKN